MIRTTESHLPVVEFEPQERLDLDKAFFRQAYEYAQTMTERQTALPHRAADDMNTLVCELRNVSVGSFSDPEKTMLTLIRIAATASRNARLCAHLAEEFRAGRRAGQAMPELGCLDAYCGPEWASFPGGVGRRYLRKH